MNAAHTRVAALAGSVVLLVGCASTVPGTAQPDPGAAGAPSSTPAPPSSGPPPAMQRSSLPIVDAGLADDCLLTTDQAAALLGAEVLAAEQTRVTQEDDRVVEACYYLAPGDVIPLPALRSQVYTVDASSDVPTVMGRIQGDPLAGVGDGAVVVEGSDTTTLWVAVGSRIATVLVISDTHPAAGLFQAVGLQVVAALGSR